MLLQAMDFHGECTMRLFNPKTMTEVIPGFHDIAGAIELPEDNWFFRENVIPEGKMLAVTQSGEPILVDVNSAREESDR